MSVEAMTMVTISGPEKKVGTAVQNLVVNREFHPESAIKLLSGAKELVPFDASNPYADPLAKARDIAKTLGIELDYRDFTKSPPTLEDVSKYLGELLSRASEISEESEEKTLLKKNNETVIEQLSHFSSFNVELSDLFTMKYAKFRFGRLPVETFKDCLKIIDERPDVYFVTSGRDEHWVYGAYFALPEANAKIEAIFLSLGFERIRIDVRGSVEDTANEVLKRLRTEADAAAERMEELNRGLSEIKSGEGEKLLYAYSWLKFENDSFDVLSYAGRRHGRFYIIGWVPKSISEAYAKECESYEGFACFLTQPGEVKETPPPVKFRKGFLSDIYQPFLEMYGVPAVGELDPRTFLAVTYTLIYGIMFGDIGQGLALAALGFILWKKKGSWLGRILTLCGLSGTCFGFVYGSVFGYELNTGFKVLANGDNTMEMLIISIALGIVFISICMIMNIITGIRQHDIRKIYFSPNGVAGFVFYVGLVAAAVLKVALKIDIFTTPFIICVIVAPLVLIFLSEPLSKLLAGRKDWKPESVGMFFVQGFFEMFETLLSYMSNTISFLRIGAYTISHAGMMMVVFLLAHDTNIPGLVLGNIIVAGLEAMLTSIQVMRLEYYEMFGRFYEGGGVKFSPKIINYKVADSTAVH